MKTTFYRSSGFLLAAGVVAALSAGACLGGDNEGPGIDQNGSALGCPDDLDFFQKKLWEPVMSQTCVLCHNATGPAKGTRMVLKPSTEAGFLEANFETVKNVAAIDFNGKPLFLLKPSGQHPDGHGGGKIFAPDSATYADFSAFVDRVTKSEGCGTTTPVGCTADGTGLRALRRLSRTEYDATIQDLFGITSTYGSHLAVDAIVNGFDNTAAQLTVSPLLADELREASEDIATKFMANPGSRLSCSPQNGDAKCASTFIDTFGKRAFRRPLTATESDRYKQLYSAYESKGFATALKLVISAILQSPSFLYRTELGAGAKAEDKTIKLTPYEIASELSYFIWGTMPDDTLFAAADSGELAKATEIDKQAQRLLADPKSDAVILRFFEQWLDLYQLAIISKDTNTYPEFTDTNRKALIEETRRFIGYVVRQGTGTLPELLTATYSFISPDLAKFYGLPAPGGSDFAKVDVSKQGRAGLLTMGGVIAVHSKTNQASPILRGKLVRERLFCQTLPPPPPNVNTTPPVIDPTKPTRDRFEAHKTQALCASCHNLMDPIGFSFGHFDGIGRYQDTENGLTIDATGEIVSTPHTNATFDGSDELAQLLEKSEDVESCFTKEWVRYGYGLADGDAVSCVNDQVNADFQKSGMKILDLILALTKSSYFTQRLSDPSAVDGGSSSTSGGGTTTSTTTSGGGGTTTSTTTSTGGGTTSSTTSGAGGSGPVDPGTKDVAVDTKIDASWPTGYQETVTVTNNGTSPVTWKVQVKIDGTIQQVWNAERSGNSGLVTFTGVGFNGTLQPGGKASFGLIGSK